MQSFWKHFFLDNGDISLIEAGRQKYVPQQMNRYKVKHDLVLHLVLEGQGLYSVNKQSYHLKTNDAFILKKGKQVTYTANEKDPWTVCWIGIGGKNLAQYVQQSLIPITDVVSFEDSSIVLENITSLVNYLYANNPHDHLDYLQVFSQLYNLLYSFNLEFPLSQLYHSPTKRVQSTLADQIYDYIYENFLQNISVLEIAEHFDISRNHLFKLCKDYFNESPKQMIQELRMNQAAQLLSGSQMHIKEIANFIGYKDAFSFSKMFKAYFNYSPSDFRKLNDDEYGEVLFTRDSFLEKRTFK